MTELRYTGTPRWRQTGTLAREKSQVRFVCVALQPDTILLRLKGTRHVVSLPYGAAYLRASVLAADQVRRAKQEARQRARKAGRKETRR